MPTLPTTRFRPQRPTSQRKTISWFTLLRSASAVPGAVAFLSCARRAWWSPAVSGSGLMTIVATTSDWEVAALWTVLSAVWSYRITDILLRRWRTDHGASPTFFAHVFALYLSGILTQRYVASIYGSERPSHTWICIGLILAVVYLSVAITWRPTAKHSEPTRQEAQAAQDHVASVAKFLGVPFAAAAFVTMILLVRETTKLRYSVVHSASHEEFALSHNATSRELSSTAAAAASGTTLLMIMLSSWTERGMMKRRAFRESTLKLRPDEASGTFLAHRFILGGAPSPDAERTMRPRIVAENQKYGDLVVVGASDRYEDLSQKALEAFRWARGFRFDYLIKTDDDMFVRLDTIAEELKAMPRTPWYWRGLAYWDIPPILNDQNKNAEFRFNLPLFPPFTAGALYILSRNVVELIATDVPRLLTKNEDQNLGIWLFPHGIEPVHDRRIQQVDVCEDDMIAKHFSDSYEAGPDVIAMYENVKNGKRLCEGFRQHFCAFCYPCEDRANHWNDWGFDCDDKKGVTLTDSRRKQTEREERSKSDALEADGDVMETDLGEPIVRTEQDWIVPGFLSVTTSTLSRTDDWHLLHWLCWTTSADTWQDRHFGTINLIFAHTPQAVVLVMSPTLPSNFFEAYSAQGYRIRVVHFDRDTMLERRLYLGPNSRRWLERWNDWANGPFFFSHLTDYLRYILLHKYGGTYMDIDALWLRAPPDPTLEFIGGDLAEVDPDQDWTLDAQHTYLAPGVMRFRKGWRAFREVTERAFTVDAYSQECFNCVGPRAITTYVKQHRSRLERHGFTILPNEVLYPVDYRKVARYLKTHPEGREAAERDLERMTERSWSLHLFGHTTNRIPIDVDSVVHVALRRFDLGLIRAEEMMVVRGPKRVRAFVDDDVVALDGPNLVFLRNGPPRSLVGLRVEASVREGKLSWGGSARARFRTPPTMIAASHEESVVDFSISKTLSSFSESLASDGGPLRFRNDTVVVGEDQIVSKMTVNALLASLTYHPPSPAKISRRSESKDFDDLVHLAVTYAGKRLETVIPIDGVSRR